MERYIGLDAHASSCTLGIVGPSGKRLGSHVVETNARALIEVLRAIPRNRHVCLEEGTLSGWLYEVLEPHVEELVVTGVRKSRGPKSDGHRREALVGRVRVAEQLRIGSLETGSTRGGASSGGSATWRGRTGSWCRTSCPGEEPTEERAPLAGRGLRSRKLGVREAGPGAVAERAARCDASAGGAPVRGARRARGPEREGREGAAGRGSQAPRVAAAEDVPRPGPDPHRGAAAGGGDTLPVPEPKPVLGVLRGWGS
jgi:hypothetical protein